MVGPLLGLLDGDTELGLLDGKNDGILGKADGISDGTTDGSLLG